MNPDYQTVPVALGTRAYDIHVGSGLLEHSGELVKPLLNRPSTVIVSDTNVATAHLATLEASLNKAGIATGDITLPPGEQTKGFKYFEDVLEQLLEVGVERNDCIIAFGGGVIGDLTGFAASVLRRGIEFIQIPTTLLSQVDSSVGGKTAINSAHGKNLIGTFHQPKMVIADISALNTLPNREVLAGYAEVLKYGLLGDGAFFDWLEENGSSLLEGDEGLRAKAVLHACKAKAEIVIADEKEQGRRALLNLGHTFGHALEAAMGYSNKLLHGEGVAIGMRLAFEFSESLGLCTKDDSERVCEHLKAVGLPVYLSDIPNFQASAEDLLAHMLQDKKVIDGKVTLILTRSIGDAFIEKNIAHDTLLSFLESVVEAECP